MIEEPRKSPNTRKERQVGWGGSRFWHEIDAEFAKHDDSDPEQGDGHGAVGEQGGPKGPALA